MSMPAMTRAERIRLGKNLRRLRERRDLSQGEVADATGLEWLTAKYISDLEYGRRLPSLQTLQRIVQRSLRATLAEAFRGVSRSDPAAATLAAEPVRPYRERRLERIFAELGGRVMRLPQSTSTRLLRQIRAAIEIAETASTPTATS